MTIITYYTREGKETQNAEEAFACTVTDDSNPRIYYENVRCIVCKEWFNHETIIWARPNGELHMDGSPYCESCCPEEPEDADET